MSLEVPVSKAGLTQNGDEACRLLQGHDAPQNEEVPLLGIRLPVLREFCREEAQENLAGQDVGEVRGPSKGQEQPLLHGGNCGRGEAAPFRDAGKDGMPERGLDSVPFRVWNKSAYY